MSTGLVGSGCCVDKSRYLHIPKRQIDQVIAWKPATEFLRCLLIEGVVDTVYSAIGAYIVSFRVWLR